MTSDTTYITGNGLKMTDFTNVLGKDIKTLDKDILEIQGKPFEVIRHKIGTLYSEFQSPVMCEDTTFGDDEMGAFIKYLIKSCNKNGGDLYNVMKGIFGEKEFIDYTSIVAYRDGTDEAFFESRAECILCARTGSGMIDPFAIPVKIITKKYVNGVETLLGEMILDNPDRLSIQQQPAKRPLLHARYFSLRAYDEWTKMKDR